MNVDKDHNRQMVKTIGEAAQDHLARYQWAGHWMLEHGGIKTVLDGACGCGYGSMILAEMGFVVVGVDISPVAIAWAKEHFSHDRIEYVCKDLLQIDTGYLEMHAVVSFETLEHVEEAPALVSIFRKVAPFILASTPNEEMYPFKTTKPLGHVRHYSPSQFDALLKGSHTLAAMTQHRKDEATVVKGREGRFLVQAREWWDWERSP